MKTIGNWIIVKKSEYPFFQEVNALIKKYPEYQEGIKQGIVHIKFLPGHSPHPKKKEPLPVDPKIQNAWNRICAEADARKTKQEGENAGRVDS